ncbi:MAG: LacI family DNA-binding transcriptional regulator [Thermoleophilia bacterium]|nr:LacI family DNA-binding transcriptional regulator [Thermoleophilia bacterium]
MRRAVTVKDVARRADVSVATVSHVLNGSRYVSPLLTKRVRDAAGALGYTPNGIARSLRLRRTQTIGLIVPDVSPFFVELARVIEDHGFAAGYTTVLGNADGHPDRERRYLETLLAKNVDGLILASTLHDAGELAALLDAVRTPVVVVDRELKLPGVDLVLADNEDGGHAATRHLLELGHTEIGCITGAHDLPPSAGRAAGYRRALAEAGIEADGRWVARGDFEYAGGRRATAELLDGGEGLTAIFASNDLMALGALGELAARGLRVPDDVSVCGFDDVFPAALVSPSLTTVHQPLHEIGRAAVDILLARIAGEMPEGPARRLFPTELVVRESTAAPRFRESPTIRPEEASHDTQDP